ncbi:MAG TPA: dihydroneopterin aldolase [Xanthobacteraceae bacterium]|jgi:dihydroneopterin aldolase|nr:dihydroneopterin aldolase [Xanthobacteraceae bacterium]
MKGTIEIAGLIIFARHGVADEEAKLGQRFSLDLELDVDFAEAIKSDRLDSTVDYGEVIAIADSAFRAKRFYLIEAAAAHVANTLLAHFAGVKSVRVKVKKPSAPVAAAIDYVAAKVERKRDG